MHSSFDPLDDETVARVRDSGVSVCPTLWVFHSTCLGAEERWDRDANRTRDLPPVVQRSWRRFAEAYAASGDVLPDGIAGGLTKAAARDGVRNAVANLRLLRDVGVPFAYGTDGPYGFSVVGRPSDELSTLHAAGLDATECLRAATSGGARVLGLSDRGSLEPGQRADLLALAGDPRKDFAALGRVHAVYRAGRNRRSVARAPRTEPSGRAERHRPHRRERLRHQVVTIQLTSGFAFSHVISGGWPRNVWRLTGPGVASLLPPLERNAHAPDARRGVLVGLLRDDREDRRGDEVPGRAARGPQAGRQARHAHQGARARGRPDHPRDRAGAAPDLDHAARSRGDPRAHHQPGRRARLRRRGERQVRPLRDRRRRGPRRIELVAVLQPSVRRHPKARGRAQARSRIRRRCSSSAARSTSTSTKPTRSSARPWRGSSRSGRTRSKS